MFQDVQTCITWMYGRMAYGCTQYPGFFNLHSLGFMREEKRMASAVCSKHGSIFWPGCVRL